MDDETRLGTGSDLAEDPHRFRVIDLDRMSMDLFANLSSFEYAGSLTAPYFQGLGFAGLLSISSSWSRPGGRLAVNARHSQVEFQVSARWIRRFAARFGGEARARRR